eukprot:9153279-Lingulodinium_polyedra.AAC.1
MGGDEVRVFSKAMPLSQFVAWAVQQVSHLGSRFGAITVERGIQWSFNVGHYRLDIESQTVLSELVEAMQELEFCYVINTANGLMNGCHKVWPSKSKTCQTC